MLIVQKPVCYDGRRLLPGHAFEARSAGDARVLILAGLVRESLPPSVDPPAPAVAADDEAPIVEAPRRRRRRTPAPVDEG